MMAAQAQVSPMSDVHRGHGSGQENYSRCSSAGVHDDQVRGHEATRPCRGLELGPQTSPGHEAVKSSLLGS